MYIHKDFCAEPEKNDLMIYACTIFPTFKLIETESQLLMMVRY